MNDDVTVYILDTIDTELCSKIIFVAVLQSGNGEGVRAGMAFIISFLISVAAGIACHYICKWLDRDND